MELTDDLKAARDIIQCILKSKKIVRMYPSNNPVYIKTLEDNFDKFREFFDFREELVLKMRQNDISWDSEQIYSSHDKEDNLALFFFKDGLRELTFHRSLTYDEMEEFLKIIALDTDREELDDDIVSMLWERDFQSIKYVADEIILADEEDYEAKAISEAREASNDQDNLMKAYEDAFKEEDVSKEISIVPLSDNELQLLIKEIDKESKDKIGKLVDLLFEVMYSIETRTDYEDSVNYFVNSVEFSMRSGNIVIVNRILSEISRILDDKEVNEDIKRYLRQILFFAGSDSIINLFGELLDSGQEVDEKVTDEFVKYLGKNAITPLMNILGDLKNIHARKVVIDALIFLGPKDIVTLSKGLNDTRWYVVRNIIYILRKIADKRSVEYLLKTVRHVDIRVRKEVIRALGELGGSGIFQTLRECLEDPEIQIRSTALRAFSNIRSEAAKRIILDKISDKYFKDRSFEEKKEYFEVLSHWTDNDVFDFILNIVKKTSFFRNAKNDETRACAAYALGLIGNKNALPVLSKFTNDSNKTLREFSYSAIKKIEYGQ